MPSSYLPLCTILFLLGFQPLLAQDCQSVDTSTCFINKKYIPGPIQVEQKSASSIVGLSFLYHPTFADITGDCYPEIIIPGPGPSILIFNAETGDTLFSIPTSGIPFNARIFSVADVDNDQIAELFNTTSWTAGSLWRRKIVCMNVDGATRWVSDDYYVDKKRENCTGTIGFADFNQDGVPEIYVGNRIFNARTGIKLADGGDFGIGQDQYFGVSVAAQLDGDPSDLELAAGYTVYKVQITNPDGLVGNTMTPYSIEVDGKYRDGLTAIGDINGDGILDVIVHSETAQFEARLYAYTLASGSPTLLAKAIPPVNSLNNEKNLHPTNAPAIGRISPYGFPSILIVREFQLLSYQYDGTVSLAPHWTFAHTDESAMTSVALFDLNGDGIAEIIHRDETHLRIIDGSSSVPVEIAATPCASLTRYEGPIVGDMLNNGSSQICVTCHDEIGGNLMTRLKVFGSPDNLPPWAPGRKVWNQYAYHINNVNDDLTIPAVQKNNAIDQDGRYNSFMEQQSLLDTSGYYRQRASSLYGELGCINYDPIIQQYTISFDLHNHTDASLLVPVGIPVAFYDGDPLISGILLGVYLTTQPMLAGESLVNMTFSFTSPPLSQLHMVVNTDKAVFSSVDEDDFSIPECDYFDNFSMTFDVPLIEVRADTICAGDAFIFYDSTLTLAGTYYHKLENMLGCDSLVSTLHLTTNDSVQILAAHTACDSFSWQGNIYVASGQYSEVFNGLNGCDSTLILELDLKYATQSLINQSACDSVIWFGDVLTQSSIYSHTLVNDVGCDSIVTLSLTIHKAQVDTIHESACQSYVWHGQTLEASGIYAFDTLSFFGCDSTAYLDLSIHDTIIRQEAISICQGDSVFIFGQYESEEMTVSKVFVSSEGCDSLHMVQLIVVPLPPASFDTISLCQGDTLYLFGKEVTTSADLSTISSGQNGCDSTAFVHIQSIPVATSTLAFTLCPQDSVYFAGQWIAKSGSYPQFLQAQNGCDSLITALVTVLDEVDNPSWSIDCDNLVIEVEVDAQAPWSILWDNGDTTAHTFYSDASTATLNLMAEPDCERQFVLDLPALPDIQDLIDPGDTTVQAGSPISMDLGLDPNLWSVEWSPAHIVNCDTCTQVLITTLENTEVTIVFTHATGCVFQTAFAIRISDIGFYIPNAFSPNGDGNNDVWKPFVGPGKTINRCSIYDRWGDLVFQSDDPDFAWNGFFNGQLAPTAVYTYVISYREDTQKDQIISGDLTLLR